MMTTEWTSASISFIRALMPQSRAPSRPTLSGVAMVQPSSRAAGIPQGRPVCPHAAVAAASTNMAARPRCRNFLPPSRMLPSPCSLLRGRRHRDFHRGPFQNFLIEGVELRIGLAPAAIGKPEIGIAEHADEADLGGIERTRQH